MYNVDEFLKWYHPDELAEGGIKAFSKPLNFTERKVKTLDGTLYQISAVFEPINKGYFKEDTNTTVVIDDEHGELTECLCNCDEFDRELFSCRHTIALQILWLKHRYGIEALANSPLKAMISEKTGLKDPFIPGILRETVSSISSLIKREENSEKGLPVLTQNSVNEKMRIETYLSFEGSARFIDFKMGTKRTYVVKDISGFLRDLEAGREVTLSKNLKFTARLSAFDTESQRILNYLLILMKEDREERYTQRFFSHNSGGSLRYVHMSGTDFDYFVEKFGDIGIYYNNKKYIFNPDEYKPSVCIQKQEYGALIVMEKQSILTRTAKWIYIVVNQELRRMSRGEAAQAEQLLALRSEEDELYVSEKDFPDFCKAVITPMHEIIEFQGENTDLSIYIPEKPVLKMYLDYPQEDMISCMGKACYRDQEYPVGVKYSQDQNRDRNAELQMLDQIRPYFHAYDEPTDTFFYQGSDVDIYRFLTEIMPNLSECGEVFISDRLKKLQVRPFKNVSVGVSIESGLLNLNMASDVFSEDELIEILSSFERKKKYYRLKNGTFVQMDEAGEEVLAALSECIRGMRKPKSAEWKLPLFRTLYLEEMMKNRDAIEFRESREYRRLIGQMKNAENNHYDLPKSLEGILRAYQVEGFQWLKTLKDSGFGGILADDMGLGKTLQVLAFLLSEKEKGKTGDKLRTLIVTPASLIYNWKHEIEKYTPQLTVKMVSGSAVQRQEMIQMNDEDADVWITSYDLLKRDIGFYDDIIFANEIIDEAQFIKNQTTHAAKSVRLIQSEFRVALTGTPIENRLSEMWSIFDYLMPGFLYAYSRFRAEIEHPIVSNQDEDVLERLRKQVHPFILRRLKKEVLKELPDKIEETISVTMSGEQKRLYLAHAQRLKMFLEKQSKEEFMQGKIEILAELTKLRQLCCSPGLLVEGYKGENAKLEACMELVRQAIDGGHKILLFSQFTSMLDQIGARLADEKIDYYRIDGSVPKEERIRLVDSFNTNEVPVFCISLKAGGTGLNLTSADIVIHYDPWWNLAAQNQATDRTHRIGQTNVVTVYQLIVCDTVEEKIQSLQKSKYKLAEDVLSGEGISSILIDREQIMSLLD